MMVVPAVFAGERIPVFVSIVPQKYFLRQIGDNLLDIQVMVHPGANPATYEPKPKQMAELSKARAYFAIGVLFEKTWLKKMTAANPKMEVVHTDTGIDKHFMQTHFHPNAPRRIQRQTPLQKSKSSPQADSGVDPHIWLSPPLVKMQAHTILTALQKIDPIHSDMYAANYTDFISRIDALHSQLKQTFEGRQGLRFMVFHPAWGYFAHTYGLTQIPIEIEGKTPKPAQLKALIEYARKLRIKVIFVQPQFSTKSAELVAKEIGAQVAFADPMAMDWMANLREIADKFTAAVK
jgi:zinc transport system substrate-binding protein